MEQKRTLWIVLATGFFLLAVVLGVMIFYQPLTTRNTPQQWITPAAVEEPKATASYSQGYAQVTQTEQRNLQELNNDTDASTALAIGPDAPSAEPTSPATSEAANTASNSDSSSVTLKAENVNVYSDGTTNIYGTTIDLNASKPQETGTVTAKNEAAKTAAEAKTAATAKTTKEEPKATSSTETKTAATTTKSSASSSKSTASTKSSTSATSSSKTAASSKTSTATAKTVKPADSYWVQVVAYTEKKNADEAREVLDKAKLPAEVFTHTDANGTLYYRVRVGPYTTSSEANYWLSKITEIQNFKTAKPYVTNTSAPASK